MKFREMAVVSTMILFLFASAFGQTSTGQEKKVDTAKTFAEIAGDYDFSFEGEFMTIVFWVEKEKLLGAPRGQEYDYAEVLPVEIENLKFEATTSEGEYYEIEFRLGDDGKIAKCILKTQGMEIEGTRVKK